MPGRNVSDTGINVNSRQYALDDEDVCVFVRLDVPKDTTEQAPRPLTVIISLDRR